MSKYPEGFSFHGVFLERESMLHTSVSHLLRETGNTLAEEKQV
jgi:hypothetical protein